MPLEADTKLLTQLEIELLHEDKRIFWVESAVLDVYPDVDEFGQEFCDSFDVLSVLVQDYHGNDVYQHDFDVQELKDLVVSKIHETPDWREKLVQMKHFNCR